jgi:glucose/arabinose dehydrogenase
LSHGTLPDGRLKRKKMKSRKALYVSLLLMTVLLASTLPGKTPAKAATNLASTYVQLDEVTAGLTQPLAIVNAGDGSGRLFVVERAGLIRIIKNGKLLSTPFLDIDTTVNSSSNEQGLLALAFHPNYASNGRFYTVYVDSDNSIVLAQFVRSPNDPDLADPNSRTTLLSFPHPNFTNHNGSTLAFGPDGYLYWSTGDGGGAGDPPNNAQNLNVLLGKILRIDVNSGQSYSIPASNPFYNSSTPGIRKEIWAYGLRNPWRISFDRQTHDLYIADVGQSAREEINFQPAGSAGGQNYGWRVMEGTLCYNSTNCDKSGKTLPVTEYDHTLGCSVTGGYVYRGTRAPSLQGIYFYADFCSGRLFGLKKDPSAGWQSAQLLDTTYSISTFGEDEQGELYLADYSGGRIYRLASTTFADVPPTHLYYRDIEILYANGLTAGCNTNPLKFCPDQIMDRAQSAVFILRGTFTSAFIPAPATHFFVDNWSIGPWAEPWAEAMKTNGISAGCQTSPPKFCPWDKTPREQAAIFALRLKNGVSYTPPPATGTVFNDLKDTSDLYIAWEEQAYKDGLIPDCGMVGTKPNICPKTLVSRGLAAYMIVRAKNLSMP